MIVADLSRTKEKTAYQKEIGDEKRKRKKKKKIASRSLCVFVGFSVLMLRATRLLPLLALCSAFLGSH